MSNKQPTILSPTIAIKNNSSKDDEEFAKKLQEEINEELKTPTTNTNSNSIKNSSSLSSSYTGGTYATLPSEHNLESNSNDIVIPEISYSDSGLKKH